MTLATCAQCETVRPVDGDPDGLCPPCRIEQDYCEALAIIAGTSALLPERRHLIALSRYYEARRLRSLVVEEGRYGGI